MTISDWVMVFAVLVAPLAAVQVQKYIELLRETRRRQLDVFQTLMASRAPGVRVSPAHVLALNRIDIEFYGRRFFGKAAPTRRERSVVECWKVYLDHLNTKWPKEELGKWVDRGEDLFLDLLYKMGEAVGYHFDKVHLRKGIYLPQAFGDQALYQREMKELVADTLSGRKPLRVELAPVRQSDVACSREEESPSEPNC